MDWIAEARTRTPPVLDPATINVVDAQVQGDWAQVTLRVDPHGGQAIAVLACRDRLWAVRDFRVGTDPPLDVR